MIIFLSLEKFYFLIFRIKQAKLLYANDKVASDVPINIEIPEINLVKRVTTNNDGYFNFTFIMENNLDKVTVELKTSDPSFSYQEQTFDSKEILKHQSPIGGYLSISKPIKEFKVGDQFETDFILSNHEHSQFSFYYYIISPNGNPIESRRIRYFEKIKFRLKSEHHPQVSLILIGYWNKNQMKNKPDLKTNDVLVIDSIQIKVNLPDNCNIKTRLFDEFRLKDSDLNKVSIFKPGEKVNLEFSSSIDQQLSLIGVDKAVYSLTANTLLVEDKLKKLYKENSLTCGLGGFTYSDNLMNSGIILFDPDNQTNHNPVSSLCKGYQNLNLKKKDSKSSNRKKRYLTNDVIDYNYSKDEESKKCCRLGIKITKFNTNPNFCYEKLKILKKYMNDTRCMEAFKNCCLNSQSTQDNKKQITLSAITLTASYQVNKESSKSTFVHIAEDDALERKTYVREDFRETWLFDILPLEK